jgi:hypothetical protein
MARDIGHRPQCCRLLNGGTKAGMEYRRGAPRDTGAHTIQLPTRTFRNAVLAKEGEDILQLSVLPPKAAAGSLVFLLVITIHI